MTVHRPIRGVRSAAPWLIAALLLAVVALGGGGHALARATGPPAVGMAHRIATSQSYSMNLTDTPAFAPRFLTAAPGTSVSIHLHNIGTIPHSFTLSNVSKLPLLQNWTPTQLNQTFHAHPPLANVTVAAGSSAYANFSIGANLSFASLEFVSLIPYQFQTGMWGFLNITSNSPPLTTTVNTTDQFAFVPAALGVEPSSFPTNVAILVTNLGVLSHTFTVSAKANVQLGTVAGLTGNATLVNVSVPTATPKTVWANFTIYAPGVYEFVCTVAGHFQNGMFGFLYAGVPVPPPAAAPSTQIVDAWLLGGSLALVGIAGLILLVATLTGRLPSPPRGPHGGH